MDREQAFTIERKRAIARRVLDCAAEAQESFQISGRAWFSLEIGVLRFTRSMGVDVNFLPGKLNSGRPVAQESRSVGTRRRADGACSGAPRDCDQPGVPAVGSRTAFQRVCRGGIQRQNLLRRILKQLCAGWRDVLTVSYLVSSYNKSEYLISVLESVLSELKQTGGDVLIIDDGSTDGSWAAIQAFGKRDARITIRGQENRGIFNVTNQLIRSGTEKWMRIIDCDDPPILGSTAHLLEIAEKENADYIFGKTIPYGPEPLASKRLLLFQEMPHKIEVIADPLKYAIREYNHVPSTALIRRSCIPPGTQLNENFISCQDLALALPIFVNSKVLRSMPRFVIS